MCKMYTPTRTWRFSGLWATTMGHLKLPQVAALNFCLNDKVIDYSDILVGKVRKKLKFDERARQVTFKAVSNFIFKDYLFPANWANFGEK